MKKGVKLKRKKENSFTKEETKKVYSTEDPEIVIVDYKDDATAF